MRKDHWPPRWDQRRKKIYYRVRADEREIYGVKDFYFLGVDETEAFEHWYNLAHNKEVVPKTISAAVGIYMGHKRFVGLKPKTKRDYIRYLTRIRNTFGKMAPRNLKPRHCYGLLERLPDRDGNYCLAVLSNVMGICVERGAIDRNPCREVKRNALEARDRYISDDELEAFLDHCTPFLRSWVGLKRITGLRQGQLRTLHMSSWDGTQLRAPGSKRGRDVIYEGPELEEAMGDVLAVRASRKVGSVYLFPNRQGAMYTDSGFRNLWQYAMAKYTEAGGKRFTEHDIRAKMVSDSEDTATAQIRAGHRDQATTKRIYERKPKVVSVLKR